MPYSCLLQKAVASFCKLFARKLCFTLCMGQRWLHHYRKSVWLIRAFMHWEGSLSILHRDIELNVNIACLTKEAPTTLRKSLCSQSASYGPVWVCGGLNIYRVGELPLALGDTNCLNEGKSNRMCLTLVWYRKLWSDYVNSTGCASLFV